MERKINISNLPKVHPVNKDTIQNMVDKTYDKLITRLNGEITMNVHFKESKTEGSREQFEVNVKASITGINLNATAREWGAEKALSVCLSAIEKEAEKAKTSNNKNSKKS